MWLVKNEYIKLNISQMTTLIAIRPILWLEASLNSMGEVYDETFSPVVKIETIRVIISIVVTLELTLHQLDVNNIFLHELRNENMYIEQPSDYVTNDPSK